MLKIDSPAKVNLCLEILNRDKSGFHEIKTIFYQVDLYDELIFFDNDNFELNCNNPQVPTDQNNLIYKAYRLLKDTFKINKSIRVELTKNIPLEAGLGGGSSNAAATLKALNQLWELNITNNQLRELGAHIGMDVPFFIEGGIALGTHFGELITPINSKLKLNLLLIKPKFSINTCQAYSNLNFTFPKPERNINNCRKALESGDLDLLIKSMHNDFEESLLPKYPKIQEIKDQLIDRGAKRTLLSGSGSCVFGVFEKTL